MTQIGALNERLQSRLEEDKKRLEQISSAELESLQKNLSEASKNALNTIGTVIAETGKQVEQQCNILTQQLIGSEAILSKAVFRAWFRSLVVGSGYLMAMVIALWAVWQSYSRKADTLMIEVSNLEARHKILSQEVQKLEQATWGLRLVESKEGKFIVLPQKKTLQPGWTIGQHPAWKLE